MTAYLPFTFMEWLWCWVNLVNFYYCITSSNLIFGSYSLNVFESHTMITHSRTLPWTSSISCVRLIWTCIHMQLHVCVSIRPGESVSGKFSVSEKLPHDSFQPISPDTPTASINDRKSIEEEILKNQNLFREEISSTSSNFYSRYNIILKQPSNFYCYKTSTLNWLAIHWFVATSFATDVSWTGRPCRECWWGNRNIGIHVSIWNIRQFTMLCSFITNESESEKSNRSTMND